MIPQAGSLPARSLARGCAWFAGAPFLVTGFAVAVMVCSILTGGLVGRLAGPPPDDGCSKWGRGPLDSPACGAWHDRHEGLVATGAQLGAGVPFVAVAAGVVVLVVRRHRRRWERDLAYDLAGATGAWVDRPGGVAAPVAVHRDQERRIVAVDQAVGKGVRVDEAFVERCRVHGDLVLDRFAGDGDWTAEYVSTGHLIRWRRLESLPWPVAYPAGRHDWDGDDPALPIAVGRDGPLVWDWTIEAFTSMLVVGRPGGGKTEFTRALATGALDGDWAEVVALDPKGAGDLVALDAHRYARYVPPGDISTVLAELEAERARVAADRMAERRATLDDLPRAEPRLVIVDEIAALDDTSKGLLERVAALGREAGFHVVACAQRPDQRFLDGAAKHNMGVRVLLGDADQIAVGMVFDRGVTVRPHDEALPGRAWVSFGGQPVEAQTYGVGLAVMRDRLGLRPPPVLPAPPDPTPPPTPTPPASPPPIRPDRTGPGASKSTAWALYLIRCQTPGHVYVGITSDTDARWRDHLAGKVQFTAWAGAADLDVLESGLPDRKTAEQAEAAVAYRLAREHPDWCIGGQNGFQSPPPGSTKGPKAFCPHEGVEAPPGVERVRPRCVGDPWWLGRRLNGARPSGASVLTEGPEGGAALRGDGTPPADSDDRDGSVHSGFRRGVRSS